MMKGLKNHFAVRAENPFGTPRRVGERAFTMVEIALSIAIVAFAMVAIIGVLPTGLQVQRDNWEETIINQDGAYLLEVIRGGGWRLDELTNFVERITISNTHPDPERSLVVGSRSPVTKNEIPLVNNSHFIIGMLSVPTFQEVEGELATNEVTALMRSISGNAAQRSQAERFRENSFTYLVTTTIAPYVPIVTNIHDHNPISMNRYRYARNTMSNLYDLRLHFRWPVNEFGRGYRVGKKEKVFRTLVSGRLMQTNVNLFHFQPSTFAPPVQ
ncbi:MAG: hypothetical protein M2R45_03062 [Verrucomicrobia subdivision 3 bacterium]|nr:hypothetical protein [Limisphaerales bacterium]MCS1416548.1 hypothetical protein [Limisphaerales bacterium]